MLRQHWLMAGLLQHSWMNKEVPTGMQADARPIPFICNFVKQHTRLGPCLHSEWYFVERSSPADMSTVYACHLTAVVTVIWLCHTRIAILGLRRVLPEHRQQCWGCLPDLVVVSDYRPLAARGSLLYFTLVQLRQLDSMYCFSLVVRKLAWRMLSMVHDV